ncbi:hypothetical protein LCGC14_1255640 [marine sediment metagenome]|uniref:Uncharacterized protein n=1 Tax=marine sediment metagenome TaxID=412755 RepID=A0A0F9LNF7_9ZZZZ
MSKKTTSELVGEAYANGFRSGMALCGVPEEKGSEPTTNELIQASYRNGFNDGLARGKGHESL